MINWFVNCVISRLYLQLKSLLKYYIVHFTVKVVLENSLPTPLKWVKRGMGTVGAKYFLLEHMNIGSL